MSVVDGADDTVAFESSARWTRALRHPLRGRILELLLDVDALSPSEIAQALDASLGVASYHVRCLVAEGLLTLERETAVRGALKHHYRLTDPTLIARLLSNRDELARLSAQADVERERVDTERRRRLGAVLAGRRQAAGLQLTDLAARVGLSAASVQRIESGDADPVYTLLCRIIDALGADVGEI